MADESYDRDVAAWATEQARRIRAGQFNQLDLDHIADEIEDVGKSERRKREPHGRVVGSLGEMPIPAGSPRDQLGAHDP